VPVFSLAHTGQLALPAIFLNGIGGKQRFSTPASVQNRVLASDVSKRRVLRSMKLLPSLGDLQGIAKEIGFLSTGKLFEFIEFGPLPLSKRKNRRYHPRSLKMR
jgi:hypothetical protein